jgi:hypothetical protein
MTGRPSAAAASVALLAASLVVFLTEVVDAAGRPLELPTHLLEWAALVQGELRLVLRAPRGHGKTTLLLADVLWCCWRHNRTATGWLLDRDVPLFDILLLSATDAQALELMTRCRDLLLANERLVGALLPEAGSGTRRRTRWSANEIRLRNGVIVRARTFGSSLRGLHPDRLLLDDVLNDENSLTSEQRDKTYKWFMGTLMPMDARQITIIGTALHQADLLPQLGKKMGHGVDKHHTPLGFRAETFRALAEVTGDTLWPERFPADKLLPLRDEDPLSFSREYQNDPRDDAASLFPYELTQRAIDAGASLTLGTGHPRSDDEVVVLGVDVARSAAARADYTVVTVVAWNRRTGARRVLDMRREKGLEFDAQIELIRDLTVRHRVMVGMVEDNGLQQWLLDGLKNRPETRGRLYGHRTGTNKANLQEGIPRLALAFRAGSWIIPSGDKASLRMARQFQAELSAYGYQDGRYAGVGEHDDTVIAAWLVERTIAWLEELIREGPAEEVIWGEDVGIERLRIGTWDDEWPLA